MASFESLLNRSVENALNQLKAAKGAGYVPVTDQQLITAIGTVIYNQLVAQGVA